MTLVVIGVIRYVSRNNHSRVGDANGTLIKALYIENCELHVYIENVENVLERVVNS